MPQYVTCSLVTSWIIKQDRQTQKEASVLIFQWKVRIFMFLKQQFINNNNKIIIVIIIIIIKQMF